jgi:hypothetical protein
MGCLLKFDSCHSTGYKQEPRLPSRRSSAIVSHFGASRANSYWKSSSLQITVCCHVTPCSVVEKCQNFGEICCVLVQGEKQAERDNKQIWRNAVSVTFFFPCNCTAIFSRGTFLHRKGAVVYLYHTTIVFIFTAMATPNLKNSFLLCSPKLDCRCPAVG